MKHTPPHLRDAAGHLNPLYAAAIEGGDQPNAESKEPEGFRKVGKDDLAEGLGESFVRTATGDDGEAELDDVPAEDLGGPFVETTSEQEFAYGTDASNPADATREPFPKS